MVSNEIHLNLSIAPMVAFAHHNALGGSLGSGHTFIPIWAKSIWIIDIWPTGSNYNGTIDWFVICKQ